MLNGRSPPILFDVNDGTLGGAETAFATYDKTFDSIQEAERDGYFFVGWFTSSSRGTMIVSGNTWTIVSNTVFYTHWSDTSFTMTFDANGGSLIG